jgi:hypothetical protein
MNTEQPAERPIQLTQTQLTTVSEFLPEGSTAIGGLVPSYEKTQEDPESFRASNCVIVICANDDHTIHSMTMCEVGGGYEITGDHVISTW